MFKKPETLCIQLNSSKRVAKFDANGFFKVYIEFDRMTIQKERKLTILMMSEHLKILVLKIKLEWNHYCLILEYCTRKNGKFYIY